MRERIRPKAKADHPESVERRYTLTFANANNSFISVNVLKKDQIGMGSYGDIFRALVEVRGQNGSTRERTFVLKDFRKTIRNRDRLGSPEEASRKALEKWKRLKQVGVRTWATYRLALEEPVILMSDGEPDESVLISNNPSRSRDRAESWPALPLDGLEEHFERAIADALLAHENNIYVDSHAWFMRAARNQDGQDKIMIRDIFIGDFDSIVLDDIPPSNRESNNLMELDISVLSSIDRLTKGQRSLQYEALLTKVIKRKIAATMKERDPGKGERVR